MSSVSQKFIPVTPFNMDDLASNSSVISDLLNSSQGAQLFDAVTDGEYINQLADKIVNRFKTLLIIGTGASSIIPRVFFSLALHERITAKFLEDLDSLKLNAVLSSIKPEDTCFLVISKSGRTREVLELYSICSAWLESKLGNDLGEHFYCITQTHSKNALLNLLNKYSGVTQIEHPNICGRYSFFSCLGMLPAVLAGFNIELIMSCARKFLLQANTKTAAQTTSPVTQNQKAAPLCASFNEYEWALESASYFMKMCGKYSNVVFMIYSSLFCGLALWFRQLVSESLGKDGRGLNPVIFEGNIDQHSQLQAYIDGLPDKFFILIMPSLKLYESIIASGILHFVDAHTAQNLWKVNHSQIQAVLDLMTKSGKNIQVIEVNAIDEQFIVSIAGCFIIETILYAKLNKMDPFSQTAVDSMKALAAL